MSNETNAERRSREYFIGHPSAWRQSDEEDLTDLLNEHAAEQRQMCADAAVKAFAGWNFGRPQSLDAALIDACQNAG